MARTALLLVRNGVTHDARVLRAARTLLDDGWDVGVLGVVTATEQRRASVHEGVVVRRLPVRSPLRALTDAARGCRRARAAGDSALAPSVGDARQPARPAGDPWPAARRGARTSRLLTTAAYYGTAFVAVARGRPQLLHCNDYNTMWIGVAARVLLGTRVLYDSHELWADRNGRPELRAWLVACEALFVRVAHAVVTASPGYARELAHRYRIPEPVVVRNIPDPPAAGAVPAERDPRLLVYVGGLLTGRGLEQAIDAMALLPGVRLRLIGPGATAYVASLADRAQRLELGDRVQFAGTVAPGKVPAAAAAGAVGLSLIQPVCRSYELTLPNKVFEYVAAGVPVLVSDLPVMRETVVGGGIGEAVAPDDPVAFAAAVQRMLEPRRNAALREAVRAFAGRETAAGERERLRGAYATALSHSKAPLR